MKNNNDKEIIPIYSYTNAGIFKEKVLSDNKNKSGIYKWVNNINDKCYVGSSIYLYKRLSKYYSINFLTEEVSTGSSTIYKALLKYGHSNFRLDIIEYCDKEFLIKREQYYIDLLKPEYNILKVAGSRLGSKQSLTTKILIANSLKNRYKKLEFSRVKLLDIETNIIKYFANNLEAAKYLRVSERTLGRYKSNTKILKKKYLITNNTEVYYK